jgi:hypothetical protein
MATRGKLNYLPSQVFCNEGQTTILVEMWEKMREKSLDVPLFPPLLKSAFAAGSESSLGVE